MTFTVVDQLRAKGFKKKVILLSSKDFHDRYNRKEIYGFDFLPWDINIKLLILSRWARFLPGIKKNKKAADRLAAAIRDCRAFIDISGYGLSTQWGLLKSMGYLVNIIIARRYGIEFFILPQSMGPFRLPRKLMLQPLLRLYMRYPQKIFIREKPGIEYIRPYAGDKAEKTHDIVLMNPSYTLSNIYAGKARFKNIKLAGNAVCVIPNLKVTESIGYINVIELYVKIIRKLLRTGNTVYILNHSSRDLDLSLDIKRRLLYRKEVLMISDDLNAIELERVIRQARFIIASRYHSIIHAYKNGIPAIIIGWALKYRELAEDFGQSGYFFDSREKVDLKKISKAIETIDSGLDREKKLIRDTLKKIRKDDIFDRIFATIDRS